jgi:hypothetical protein
LLREPEQPGVPVLQRVEDQVLIGVAGTCLAPEKHEEQNILEDDSADQGSQPAVRRTVPRDPCLRTGPLVLNMSD